MDRFLDYFFWFTQPSTILSEVDKLFAYIFIGMMVSAILFRLAAKFAAKHPINKKLLMKFWQLMFVIGFSGVFWAVLRYENTYIFARRYWAGLNFIVGLLWLGMIAKYVIFNYRSEKSNLDREQLKSKYLPKAK